MLEVLHEAVVARERVLHRDVVRAGVRHERDEEQARVEPAEPVVAVGEVVAAAQHPHAAVVRGVRETHVAVQRHERLVVAPGHREVRLGELRAAGQRRTLALGPADERLLLTQRRAVPRLDRHADPPGHEVRPAGEPRRVVGVRGGRGGQDPDVLGEVRGVLGLEVGGAVLEAEQVARRALRGGRRRRAPVAELRPADRRGAERRARQVADRVHRDLRVVRARLDDEVAVAARRVEGVGGEVGELDERVGQAVGEAEAVGAVGCDEQRAAEPERDRQARCGQVGGLARVVGRRVVRARRGAVRARRQTLREPRGDRRPALQERDEVVAVVRRDVERCEVEPVLRGRDDPGLVITGEREGPRGGRSGGLGRGAAAEAEARRADGGGPEQPATEQRTARHAARLGDGTRLGVGRRLGGAGLLGHLRRP